MSGDKFCGERSGIRDVIVWGYFQFLQSRKGGFEEGMHER